MWIARKKTDIRGRIQKYLDWVDNEINNKKNKHVFRSNAKGYGGRTHCTDSQLNLGAESYIICSSRSRWPIWKLLDTPSYACINSNLLDISHHGFI
jgi:hypothetical protein